jgi:hypothetical protein
MLRIAPAVPIGLPRIVPPSGAVIAGVRIPGGVRPPPLPHVVTDHSQIMMVMSQSAPFPNRSPLNRASSFPSAGSSRDRKHRTSGWSPFRRVHEVVLALGERRPAVMSMITYVERNHSLGRLGGH